MNFCHLVQCFLARAEAKHSGRLMVDDLTDQRVASKAFGQLSNESLPDEGRIRSCTVALICMTTSHITQKKKFYSFQF